jgi:hypothetical protein
MQMRMEVDPVAEGLDGDDNAGNAPLARQRLKVDGDQGFPDFDIYRSFSIIFDILGHTLGTVPSSRELRRGQR